MHAQFLGARRAGDGRNSPAPGREDDTKSWQGAVEVGVRVFVKMGGQGGPGR
jgi:hypothetical protein